MMLLTVDGFKLLLRCNIIHSAELNARSTAADEQGIQKILLHHRAINHVIESFPLIRKRAIQGGNGGFRISGFFWDFEISFGFSDFENPKIQLGYPLADNEISNQSFSHM